MATEERNIITMEERGIVTTEERYIPFLWQEEQRQGDNLAQDDTGTQDVIRHDASVEARKAREAEERNRLFVISKMNSDVRIDRHGTSLLYEHFCVIRLLLKRGRHKLLRGGRLRIWRTIDCERSREWRSKERESKSKNYGTSKMSNAA